MPLGALARDENTPAKNLTLLLNSVSGQQSVSFPKGRRIEPVGATTVLAGDTNKYPFEAYRADIDAVVSIPAKQSVEQLHIDTLGIAESIDPEDLIVGVGDLTHSQLVPICEKVTASIPQFKFSGVVERDGTHKLTHTHISSRRANSVIMTSLAVMITLLLSALSVAAMVVRAALSDGGDGSSSTHVMHVPDFRSTGTAEYVSRMFPKWACSEIMFRSSGLPLSSLFQP